MAEILSFPGMGLEFEINRVAFNVAGYPVYWYGIIVALAFLSAAAYVLFRVKDFGLDGDRVMDVVLGGVLFGIVGARLYYVMFRLDATGQDLLSVFNIREGGIAIYGGIIGGVIAAVIFCRLRKVKLLPMLDLASGGIMLGQAIGRWGNFVNMEAFGANTTAKWGMTSPSISWYLNHNAAELSRLGVEVQPEMPVHPTFFYESMWCLLGFLFIAWFTMRRRFDGELGLIYMGWYGLGRFFIEGLRTDSLMLGTMRVSQVVALICVLASASVLYVVMSKIKRANDPDYMPLYVNTDEGRAVLAGEFYKKKDALKKEETAEEKSDAKSIGHETADEAVTEHRSAVDNNEELESDAVPTEQESSEKTEAAEQNAEDTAQEDLTKADNAESSDG